MHLITAGFVLSAGAQTVLIDYNDGVANGVHEASVLNGSFDAPSTPAKFGEMADWYCLLPNAAGTYDYQVTAAGNTPRTGSTAAFLSTDQGGAAGVNPAVFGSTTGYTIQEGTSSPAATGGAICTRPR